jgi:hypothetical protein
MVMPAVITRFVKPVVLLATAVSIIGVSTTAEQRDRAVAQRVAALSARLQGTTPYEGEGRNIADAIRKEIAAFVESDFSPSESSELMHQRLITALGNPLAASEFGDPPKIRAANLRHGRGLLVAYSIAWPPHFDAPTITAFSEAGGQFTQTASVGEHFDGYGLFTHDIASPVQGVLWVLAGGQAHTFNGAKFRFRLYAFDGATLDTIWAPDDMFSAKLEMLADGFAITHLLREDRSFTTEQYKTTVNGLVRVR